MIGEPPLPEPLLRSLSLEATLGLQVVMVRVLSLPSEFRSPFSVSLLSSDHVLSQRRGLGFEVSAGLGLLEL